MKMTLETLELEKLLPKFMQKQADDVALARGLNESFRYMGRQIKWNAVWNAVDLMSEEFLDNLARELDIDWYDYSADISAKRTVIKDSDKVHRILGTKKAIIMVLEAYFEGAICEEWFEYGGEPQHFRVSLVNYHTIEIPDSFYVLLDTIKRRSAWLDRVQTKWDAKGTYYAGAGVQTVWMGAPIYDDGTRPDVRHDIGYHGIGESQQSFLQIR